MTDPECVAFLQWALPRLHLRWPGYRKVRRQVCKRIARRLAELNLPDLAGYRDWLDTHPDEWPILDRLCWISISRFYRDRAVFQFLEQAVLPDLAGQALARGEQELRCWSAGCASGEEPYTLAILWHLRLAPRFPALCLRVLATDADARAIERARQGCYPAKSLKDLPEEWNRAAFARSAEGFCLKPEYRDRVAFQPEDIRTTMPAGPFHLILCRNLAFTYFDEAAQRTALREIAERLAPGGALLIGKSEHLPDANAAMEPWNKPLGFYRKAAGPAGGFTENSRSSRSRA